MGRGYRPLIGSGVFSTHKGLGGLRWDRMGPQLKIGAARQRRGSVGSHGIVAEHTNCCFEQKAIFRIFSV